MLEQRRTVDVKTTAKILGIGISSAFEAIRRGEIPHIRVGKRILVPIAALRQMLKEVEGEVAEDEG